MANDPHFFTTASVGFGGSSTTELSLDEGVVLGNKYRLLRPAGFGGMGAVWVARNEATAAEVVVKVLVTAREGVDGEAIARFRREAHTAAQLYHRGIVRIFDLVELSFKHDDLDSSVRQAKSIGEPPPPDALVLVMELLRGETLASHMDKKVRFSQEEALAIVLPLLSALAHAHAQGIVHRDLKPENVFLSVDPDGHVIPKILDFGISKLLQPAVPRITTDGAMLGTPSYMSPEQARGLPNVDARADVFAAGILLYECLAGENPFSSGSYHSVVAAILEREPPVLKMVSPEVWRVIKRALEKPAALRYADAGELASALIAASQGQRPEISPAADSSGAYSAPRPSVGDRSVPPAPFREAEPTSPSLHVGAMRRRRARATIGAVVLAGSLAIAAGFYTQARTSTRAPAAAPLVVTPPSAARPADVVPSAASPDPSVSASAASPAAASAASAAPAASAAEPEAESPAAVQVPASGRARPPSRAPGTAHPKPASPPPSPSPTPPAASAPERSTVVRDPGF